MRSRMLTLAVLVASSMALVALTVSCTGTNQAHHATTPPDPSASKAPHVVTVNGSYRWTALPVGAGGYVTGLVAVGPEPSWYARTDVGGAYRWDPRGRKWIQLLTAGSVPDAQPGDTESVASIAAAPSDPQRVYAAVGNDTAPGDGQPLGAEGRVLVSDDGGTTWRTGPQRWSIDGNAEHRTGSERLAVDPHHPDHALFGTSRSGLWETRDGGRTWARVDQVPDGVVAPTSDDQPGVYTVAFVGNLAIAGVANVGIFTSPSVTAASAASRWTRVRNLEPGTYAAGISEAGGAAWMALDTESGAPATLARFDPSTQQWSDRPFPGQASVGQFAMDPTDPAHIVASGAAVTNDQLYTSNDGGQTWSSHRVKIHSPAIPWLERTDLASYMSVGRFVFDPHGGRVWFAEGMAVWTTDDIDAGTVEWTSNSVGIEEIVAAGVMAAPGAAPIGIAADRQGFRFADITRYPASPLIDERFAGGTSADYSAGQPSVMAWVGAEYNIYDSPDRRVEGAISHDGGVTWKRFKATDRAMFGGEIAVSATNPDDLVWLPTHFRSPDEFRSQPVGLFVSHDGGASWQHQTTVGGLDSFHRFMWWLGRRALAADRVNGNFYLMSDEGAFFVSTDGGTTWTKAAHAPPCVEDTACHVVGQVQAEPGAAEHLWAGVGSGGLYASDDAGRSSWHKIAGVDDVRAFTFGAPVAPSTEPTLFVYGKANGDIRNALYRSTDGGTRWTMVSRFPAGHFADVTGISGDPDVPGRVYVAFSGLGFAQGDPVS